MNPKDLASRRLFLECATKAMAAAVCGGVGVGVTSRAAEPVSRRLPSKLSLGLAAYSFRDFFIDSNHTRERQLTADKRISIPDFIDFCASNGCDGVELTSYYFPRSVTPEFLSELRHRAFVNGMVVSGSAVGNRFTIPKGEERDREIAHVKQWIDHTSAMGASHLRVFSGDKGKLPVEDARNLCVEALEECCDYAGKRGVFLGIENHGGIVAEADGLLEIVKAVKSSWLGVNLDTGNFHTPDPYSDLARCAPYAVNVQIKSEIQPRGVAKGLADLPRLVKILRDAGYRGFVTLEYEAAEDAWTAVPRLLKELKRLLVG